MPRFFRKKSGERVDVVKLAQDTADAFVNSRVQRLLERVQPIVERR